MEQWHKRTLHDNISENFITKWLHVRPEKSMLYVIIRKRVSQRFSSKREMFQIKITYIVLGVQLVFSWDLEQAFSSPSLLHLQIWSARDRMKSQDHHGGPVRKYLVRILNVQRNKGFVQSLIRTSGRYLIYIYTHLLVLTSPKWRNPT